jgi:hypothetical protein
VTRRQGIQMVKALNIFILQGRNPLSKLVRKFARLGIACQGREKNAYCLTPLYYKVILNQFALTMARKIDMRKSKVETITFKVEESLAEALRKVPNRSQFIRSALLAALDGVCPLCQGTGLLTPEQKRHWEAFKEHHYLARCDDCKAVHLVCSRQAGEAAH